MEMGSPQSFKEAITESRDTNQSPNCCKHSGSQASAQTWGEVVRTEKRSFSGSSLGPLVRSSDLRSRSGKEFNRALFGS